MRVREWRQAVRFNFCRRRKNAKAARPLLAAEYPLGPVCPAVAVAAAIWGKGMRGAEEMKRKSAPELLDLYRGLIEKISE